MLSNCINKKNLTSEKEGMTQIAGSFGLYQEENATDRRDWNRKVS